MSTTNYSASQLVRIELLRYSNPEGLHPIELQWRDLARALLNDVEKLQDLITKHHESFLWKGYSLGQDCPVCTKASYTPTKMPKAFSPIV